jgi:CHAT domain-containing protein
MPYTPAAPDLPHAQEEVDALLRRLPRAQLRTGREATRDAILTAIAGASWVHFACHAVSAADATSGGHLLLNDHQTRLLTVADIARLRLDGANLAYLSACDTTRTRESLADEALHITGAFSLAGYPNVIGTLWQVDDEAAGEIADAFYDRAADRVSAEDPARALHAAIRTLRHTNPRTPSLWAAHIHVGT